MKIPLALAAGFLGFMAFGQNTGPMFATSRAEVLNQPFSAEAITTSVKTLPDGTHINQPAMTIKMYRDSAGRTRSDRMPGSFAIGAPAPPTMILINDPLAGYSYVLDTVNKTAMRRAIRKVPAAPQVSPQNVSAPAAPPVWAKRPRPEVKTEDLGSQTMEGLTVTGRRTTTTYLAGTMGNDRNIVTTAEVWSNSEMRLMMLQRRSDPRMGETTTKIENLSRTQPSAALFEIPLDYKVIDQPTQAQ